MSTVTVFGQALETEPGAVAAWQSGQVSKPVAAWPLVAAA
jgi:hypothetical protein